jgi:DNA-binding transcriptional ArsR family regulator
VDGCRYRDLFKPTATAPPMLHAFICSRARMPHPVSRQLARLEELGLIIRRERSTDRRTRDAILTPQGKVATDAVNAARMRLALRMFRNWSSSDYDDLLRLTRMLADGLHETPAPGSKLAEGMARKKTRDRS